MTSRIVNRVPLLHRPPGPNATVPAILAYWKRRWPQIDWDAVIDTAVLEAAFVVGNALGLSWGSIWEMRDAATSAWTLSTPGMPDLRDEGVRQDIRDSITAIMADEETQQ